MDERKVRSSSGHAALRPVIRTRLALGPYEWPIELTLASRDAKMATIYRKKIAKMKRKTRSYA